MDSKLINVQIKSGPECFSGVYIKNREKDFIITCEHGLATSEEHIEIRFFVEGKLKKSSLVIDKIYACEKRDLAILTLKNNIHADIRDLIPQVLIDANVEKKMEYEMSGFPFITLRESANQLKQITIILTSKCYEFGIHKISVKNYDTVTKERKIKDNLGGLSGSPIFQEIDEKTILLKGIFLGTDNEQNVFKIGRIADMEGMLDLINEKNIPFLCFNEYLIIRIEAEAKKIINELEEVFINRKELTRSEKKIIKKKIKDIINILNDKKIELETFIKTYFCNETLSREELLDSINNTDKLIRALIFSKDELELKISKDYIDYNNSKSWLLNPNGEKTRGLNIIVPQILDYILCDRNEELRGGNVFVHHSPSRSQCQNCQIGSDIIENAKINLDLIPKFLADDRDFLSCSEKNKIRFICAGCFEDTQSTVEKGSNIWGLLD